MHSVGRAFLWEFWRRYRILTSLALAYFFVLLLVVHSMPSTETGWTMEPSDMIGWTVPLWGIIVLLVATFGQVENGDILARGSPFPRRLFTVPVRTTALVGWPMAIGATILALAWLLLDAFFLRARAPENAVPLYWPAVFLAALLAWWQALIWSPYPLIALRIFVAVPVLGAMVTGAALGHAYRVPSLMLMAVSAALVPAGYLIAVVGVARARRGDVPVWNWPFFHERAGPAAQRPAFASAAEALHWLDWRRNGYVLPFLIALMLVPELGTLLFFGAGELPELTTGMFLLSVVTIGPLMAAAAGASLGNTRTWGPASYAMPAFTAARPIASAEIIAAKFHVALRVFLYTWTISLAWIAVMVPLTQIGTTLAGWARQVSEIEGIHGGLLLGFGLLALTVFSLKAMLDHLCIGLSGRIWVNIAWGFAFMVAAIGLTFLIRWITLHPEWHDDLLAALPWLAGLALALKLGLGMLVAWIAQRRGLVAPQTAMRFVVAFIAAAAALFALAFWLTPPQFCTPLLSGCIAVVVLLPLVRLGLAPLALDWNRHR
jgi:hypothetical protein